MIIEAKDMLQTLIHIKLSTITTSITQIKNSQIQNYLSHLVRKPTICICDNCEADQRLYFRYMDSTLPLLLKSEI